MGKYFDAFKRGLKEGRSFFPAKFPSLEDVLEALGFAIVIVGFATLIAIALVAIAMFII